MCHVTVHSVKKSVKIRFFAFFYVDCKYINFNIILIYFLNFLSTLYVFQSPSLMINDVFVKMFLPLHENFKYFCLRE